MDGGESDGERQFRGSGPDGGTALLRKKGVFWSAVCLPSGN